MLYKARIWIMGGNTKETLRGNFKKDEREDESFYSESLHLFYIALFPTTTIPFI